MRIVNLQEFRELPNDIVFMKFEPCIFDELSVKVDLCGDSDFFYCDITAAIDCNDSSEFADLLIAASKDSSISLKMDLDCTGRDGLYEDKQLFAVYEQEDIDNLRYKLKYCVGA